nr:hypothetical protein Iba_chr09aCG7400 [Ipomoea batatas]
MKGRVRILNPKPTGFTEVTATNSNSLPFHLRIIKPCTELLPPLLHPSGPLLPENRYVVGLSPAEIMLPRISVLELGLEWPCYKVLMSLQKL